MPERPFLQTNDYKERSYPVWNLIKELAALGKLTPVQAVLAAPHMPPEELYDVVEDPYEIHNLADSSVPEHQAARQRLGAALERWIEESNDQGRTPEPPAVAAAKGATRGGSQPEGGGQPEEESPEEDPGLAAVKHGVRFAWVFPREVPLRRPRPRRPNLPGRSRA